MATTVHPRSSSAAVRSTRTRSDFQHDVASHRRRSRSDPCQQVRIGEKVLAESLVGFHLLHPEDEERAIIIRIGTEGCDICEDERQQRIRIEIAPSSSGRRSRGSP